MKPNLRLKNAILESGIKQFVLARQANISESRLSRIIHGRVIPSPEEKERIAAVVGKTTRSVF